MKEINKMDKPKKDQPTEVTFSRAQLEKQQKERREMEHDIDAEMQQRTATFDQELVRQARAIGINPDNFDTEELLETAIRIRQDEIEQDERRLEDEKNQ